MNYEKAMERFAALRSGKFKQGRGALTREQFDCCLGVACKGAIKDGLSLNVEAYLNAVQYDGTTYYLPLKVQEWGEFNSRNPEFYVDSFTEFMEPSVYRLSDLDDDGFTFDQIADLIECFWYQL